MKGGEAYRDPFDLMYWQMSPRDPVENKNALAGARADRCCWKVIQDCRPRENARSRRMANWMRRSPAHSARFAEADKAISDKPPQGLEQKDALSKETPRPDAKPMGG